MRGVEPLDKASRAGFVNRLQIFGVGAGAGTEKVEQKGLQLGGRGASPCGCLSKRPSARGQHDCTRSVAAIVRAVYYAYVISGNEVTRTPDGGSANDPTPFCVSGNEIKVDLTSTDSAGVTVSGSMVLTKQ
jgi:hypothetical protein